MDEKINEEKFSVFSSLLKPKVLLVFLLVLILVFGFIKGWTFLENRKNREAAKAVEEFLSNQAKTMYDRGELDQLARLLLEKLGQHPNNPALLVALANVYAQQGILNYSPKEAAIRARTYVQKALDVEPNNFSALRVMGFTYELEENYNQAVKYYQKAIMVDPKSPEIYSQLGHVLEMSGDFIGAIENYKKSLDLEKNAGVYVNLARIYLKSGLIDSAIDLYDQGLKLSVNNEQKSGIYATLGSVYSSSMERTEENKSLAVDYFSKALELNKNNSLAYSNLGNEYYLRLAEKGEIANFEDNIKKIDQYFSSVIKINPNESNAYRWYGMTLIVLGDLDSAIQAFDEGLLAVDKDGRLFFQEKIDEKARFYLGKGFIFAQKLDEAGSLEKSLENIQSALELNPNLLSDVIEPELEKGENGFLSKIKDKEAFKGLISQFSIKVKQNDN